MFRTVPLSNISSLFTVHSAVVYSIQVCGQWINCWWWTEELSETCRVSWQNKFEKVVHLVGFITKKEIFVVKDFVLPGCNGVLMFNRDPKFRGNISTFSSGTKCYFFCFMYCIGCHINKLPSKLVRIYNICCHLALFLKNFHSLHNSYIPVN
jgi:hypothetical protein